MDGTAKKILQQIILVVCIQLAMPQCIVTIIGPLSVERAPATAQQFTSVYGLASDGSIGGYYTSDNGGNRVQRIFANGTMVTVAGINRNVGGSSGNGGPGTSATLSFVSSLSSDGAGGVFIADRANDIVRLLYSNGTIVLFAGNGTGGWFGDGG